MSRFCFNCKHSDQSFADQPCSECCHLGNKALWEGECDENPYWERICKLSDAQRKKGMETYGQGLESNPAAILKRIEHLQEELVDALYYCEWLKDKLVELEGGSE